MAKRRSNVHAGRMSWIPSPAAAWRGNFCVETSQLDRIHATDKPPGWRPTNPRPRRSTDTGWPLNSSGLEMHSQWAKSGETMRTILFVDDEPAILEALKRMLR